MSQRAKDIIACALMLVGSLVALVILSFFE